MQDFLFVNCQGNNQAQAIIAMQQQLTKLQEDARYSDFEILSISFVPGLEQGPPGRIIPPGHQNVIAVINCTAVLVRAASMSSEELRGLRKAQQMTCTHEHLDPLHLVKTHMKSGTYYQVCRDCGAEVWSDPPESERQDRDDRSVLTPVKGEA